MSKYSLKWAECTYCGQPATEFDHIIPVSHRFDNDTERTRYRASSCRVGHLDVVPACRNCNRRLGASYAHTIHDRAIEMNHRFSQRYDRLYRVPLWSDEEIHQLGHTLRLKVIEYDKKRLLLLEQLRHSGTVLRCEWITSEHIWEIYYTGSSILDYIRSKTYSA